MRGSDDDINPTAASVLGFLSIGPMTGWSMNELAQVSVNHFWSMSKSQIYRELASLTELGLVEAEAAGPRNTKRYWLTPDGRTRLHAWLTDPPADSTTRIPFLVKLFFADQLTDEERDDLVAHARARHEQNLATLENVIELAEQLSPHAAATARYGVAVERAILEWFDEAPWDNEQSSDSTSTASTP